MKTVLVTGGLGVIGSWVVDGLVRKGLKVVAHDERKDFSLLTKDAKESVVFRHGSILDLPSLAHLAKEEMVEGIIHLAAVLPSAAQANPYWGYKVNVEGAMNIFEVARMTGGSRVVYASTRSVYGNIKGEFGHPSFRPLSEDGYRTVPCNVYGATKLAVEHLSENYRREFGCRFIGLRFPAMYGPGRLSRHGPVSLTSKIVENGFTGVPFEVPVGGEQRDDLLYVKDGASALIAALLADAPKRGIYNVGSGETRSLTEFADIVKSLCPKAKLAVGSGLNYVGFSYHQEYSFFDFSRAKAELGYAPKFTLEAGIRDYLKEIERIGPGR